MQNERSESSFTMHYEGNVEGKESRLDATKRLYNIFGRRKNGGGGQKRRGGARGLSKTVSRTSFPSTMRLHQENASRAELDRIIQTQQDTIHSLQHYLQAIQRGETPETPIRHDPDGHVTLLNGRRGEGRDSCSIQELQRKIKQVEKEAKAKVLSERLARKQMHTELMKNVQKYEHLTDVLRKKKEENRELMAALKASSLHVKQMDNQVSLMTMERNMLRQSVMSLQSAID